MKELLAGFAAACDADIIARNWSGGGEIVLALYKDGDSYMGLVQLDGRKCRVVGRWAKNDLRSLERFSAHYVRHCRLALPATDAHANKLASSKL